MAPARLHLGFLDLHGGLGRRFGSLGLTIEGIGTRVRLRPAAAGAISAAATPERAASYLRKAQDAFGLPAPVDLAVAKTIPEHAGLGSGTQLGLAVAAALTRLHGRAVPARALADAVDRGARSGIGIGAFESGGFLVDGGRAATAATAGAAPIIARLPFPEDWPILLIFDAARQGLHGRAETAAFGQLPEFTEQLAGRLCRVVLMQLLPGIAERDLAATSAALREIQAHIGDHFAAAQGGRFASPAVADALAWLEAEGIAGIGQSSWGPTGFAIVDDEKRAQALARHIGNRVGAGTLACRIVRARNAGAAITEERQADDREGAAR